MAPMGPGLWPSHVSANGSFFSTSKINSPSDLPGANIIKDSGSLNPV
ncbi:uncharacterized protein METZ01_LOCUS60113 [marine metagenome]|uniref:Uncharacterized protein n=1 Tax=marine metagenome TaxID=408172 RepID=A0A381SUZ3_9ZZZZ